MRRDRAHVLPEQLLNISDCEWFSKFAMMLRHQ